MLEVLMNKHDSVVSFIYHRIIFIKAIMNVMYTVAIVIVLFYYPQSQIIAQNTEFG